MLELNLNTITQKIMNDFCFETIKNWDAVEYVLATETASGKKEYTYKTITDALLCVSNCANGYITICGISKYAGYCKTVIELLFGDICGDCLCVFGGVLFVRLRDLVADYISVNFHYAEMVTKAITVDNKYCSDIVAAVMYALKNNIDIVTINADVYNTNNDKFNIQFDLKIATNKCNTTLVGGVTRIREDDKNEN